MTVRIAPSILAADLWRLGEDVERVEAGGADQLHVDVMDGHFVPNLSLGPSTVAALKRKARIALDVHLMIQEPERYLEAFVRAGADMISVHVEVSPHLHRTLARIHELGAKAGVAINPSTPVDAITDVLGDVDHVLVMSVDPGFGGQTFIPHSVEKIAAVRGRLTALGRLVDIEVDGGVDLENAGLIVRAGATVLVAGTSIFGTADPAEATRALRRAAMAGA